MGVILDSSGPLHAEVRSRSFVIFTDFGKERLELDDADMEHLERMIQRIREHAPDRFSATARGGENEVQP
jgi:hypothetical protein